ncbi:heavy metal tolerance protein [Plectosphaerella plurivora]|uniref:Heavy metal tolerance protein n=1 Tax=Plectosphaerella plurivora TaxID=936078 RepID=A0A9P9AB73_9PEZI|nr:heavy metal tolerance protein [Plectosphaerella plurivora]
MEALEQARTNPVSEPVPVASYLLDLTLETYPLALLVVFILVALTQSVTLARNEEAAPDPDVLGPGGKPLPVTKKKRRSADPDSEPESWGPQLSAGWRIVCIWLSTVLCLTFFANMLAHLAHTFSVWPQPRGITDVWHETGPMSVYLFGGTNLHGFLVLTLFQWQTTPSVAHFMTWCLALVGESTITLTSLLLFRDRGEVGGVSTVQQPFSRLDGSLTKWEVIDVVLGIARLALVSALVIIYAAAWTRLALSPAPTYELLVDSDEAQPTTTREPPRDVENVAPREDTPLLRAAIANYQTQNGHQNGHGASPMPNPVARNGNAAGRPNGSAPVRTASGLYKDDSAAFYRPEKMPHKTWWEYIRGYGVFFQYVYPKKSLKLQALCLLCVGLVIAQRVINVLVPLQVGYITKRMIAGEMPWTSLTLLIVYKLFQGSSMLLGAARAILWVPVSQYSYRALTTSAFEHVHSLSLDFHLGKRTGEVLSALNKGASINQFLEQITFQVAPMIMDLGLAIVVFNFKFDSTYAVIVTCLAFWYLYLTIRMAQTRADQRRIMTNADREEEAVKNDSITSYETVKYFNAERWEFARYRNAIINFQAAEKRVTEGINVMNCIQAFVFISGYAIIIFRGAYQVYNGDRDTSDFMALLTYLGQLQQPLNYFSNFYRTIQQSMISGERLLELFKIKPTVVDAPGARVLDTCSGHIRWNDVGFAYDPRTPALQNLSFECAPGTTTAFVGESGGGKSTVFRLMFRYYNTTEGSIEVDGLDVKGLTIDSVRSFIGVVPQDTTLFNETLMYNLKYAKPNCTDEDVYDACRAAAIHDRIMTFPDGYNTKVGDRGLRLSGGERQRVAIARTILKDPKIIMLDEATSALDAHTEQEIQEKLENLGQGRTLLLIAHRLSTVTHADQIIVLNNGQIVEKGTHEELVAKKGRYASMWEKQVQAERAAEKARVANRKAHKLMRKANIVSQKLGSDGTSDGYNSLASSTILPGPNNQGPKSGSQGEDSSSSGNSSDAESTHTSDAERH